jgi:hypothetical protein
MWCASLAAATGTPDASVEVVIGEAISSGVRSCRASGS